MPFSTHKKRRIAVLIGSPYNVLAKKGNLYRLIERKLNSKFKKVSKYVYKIETKENLFYFYACYKPKKDKSYISSKKHFEKLGEQVPPPIQEVIKKIKNVDLLLILGTCGSLDSRKNQIYLPTEFYNISFKDTYIKKEDLKKIKVGKSIKCDNILLDKLKGKKSKVITSNITFIPDRMENNSKKDLKILVNKLNKKINCVDLESYYIVKKFSNKIPIGILLFSSDIIGKHTKMRFKLREFQKRVSDMVGDLTK